MTRVAGECGAAALARATSGVRSAAGGSEIGA
jgi:hypothetical protein